MQAFLSAIRRTFVQHFTRFQLTALHDQLSPKWAWLRPHDCPKFWANKCYISKTVYNIETYFQWKTNRKSYVAYGMAPVLVTLKVIHRLQAFSSAIRQTFVQYFTRFQLTARSRSPSATAGLLVFICEVVLLWEKDYCDAVRQPTVQSAGGGTRLRRSVR